MVCDVWPRPFVDIVFLRFFIKHIQQFISLIVLSRVTHKSRYNQLVESFRSEQARLKWMIVTEHRWKWEKIPAACPRWLANFHNCLWAMIRVDQTKRKHMRWTRIENRGIQVTIMYDKNCYLLNKALRIYTHPSHFLFPLFCFQFHYMLTYVRPIRLVPNFNKKKKKKKEVTYVLSWVHLLQKRKINKISK